MQRLCSRVAELLRSHPILWLPYVVAHLLAVGLWRLRGLAQARIVHFFTTSGSVLGGDTGVPQSDPSALTRAFAAYLPIGITSIVAVVYLFVIALLATATVVHSIEREHRLDQKEMLGELVAEWRRALLFALRFLITLVACAAALLTPTYYSLIQMHRWSLVRSVWFEAAMAPIIVGCVAWLVMPSAIRLLRGTTTPVSAQQRTLGTIQTILAVEAGIAIGYLVPKFESAMLLDSRWEAIALSVSNSVVANAPLAVLFVGLSVLANQPPTQEPSEGSRLRGALPILMPMHFGNSEEPPQTSERPNTD